MNYRLALAADTDLEDCLRWSAAEFGHDAAVRYASLIEQPFCDLAEDPRRPGSRYRAEFGFHFYHLRHSRDRVTVQGVGMVRNPRHFVVFRVAKDVLEVVRILHDSMEFGSHLGG